MNLEETNITYDLAILNANDTTALDFNDTNSQAEKEIVL